MVLEEERQGIAIGGHQGGGPFSMNWQPEGAWGRVGMRVSPIVERILALDALNDLHRRVKQGSPETFFERVLADLQIRCDVAPADLSRVPVRGPLVVVANHPFGAIDGIALGAVLRRVRPDLRVMANFLLGRIPELRETFFLVDPFGGAGAERRNCRPLLQAMRWVAGGGALLVFPAGEVAHLQISRGAVVEGPWTHSVGRLVRRTNASVLPVYVDGTNGALFHMLGLIHPRLRTAMLPRQVFRQAGKILDIRIGTPISSKRMAAIDDDSAATAYFRERTLLLGRRATIRPRSPSHSSHQTPPIAPALVPDLVADDVTQLPSDQLLVDVGEQRVYIAYASQIPHVMREIGRLREITYRACGEGTGNAVDLDRFDEWYLHLFIYDHLKSQLVGAYRLGATDKILSQRGPGGLYTSTLFDFSPRLLGRFNPALELGRAFVRTEYQRGYAPLMLLWKGIAQYVAAHPWYSRLFGPVSISNEYSSPSRELLVRFLRSNYLASELAPLARPRNPFNLRKGRSGLGDLGRLLLESDDVDDLVGDLETDGKGVPVLLRQYLKLGALLRLQR